MKKSVKYIELSSLVPKEWDWFYGLISENAPFSWGDNDITLVRASRFYPHVCNALEDMADEGISQTEINLFLEMINEQGDTYIDLEN